MHRHIIAIFVHPVVSRLAKFWKTRIETTVFCLRKDMKGFTEKYDAVQQLSSIARMDDLLSDESLPYT